MSAVCMSNPNNLRASLIRQHLIKPINCCLCPYPRYQAGWSLAHRPVDCSLWLEKVSRVLFFPNSKTYGVVSGR